MPACLGMNAAVVFECKQVGVGLEAHSAVVDADCVGVFVVKERAGMPVRTATLVTSVKTETQEKVNLTCLLN